LAQIRVFNPSYTPRSYFADQGEEGGKSTMAKHHHHHRRRRRNPFGVNGTLVKDVAFNAAGLAGATWGASFLGQSGWLDVLATAGAAVAVSYAGKAVAGAPASEELLKGGILAALLKAVKQTGISVPGLSGMGMYTSSYFPVPTSSDAYGRASAPVIALPPAPSGKGLSGQRYRSRYQTRF
jgi:hypothetical protein